MAVVVDLDIPETAMRNKPLSESILGSDGIWDDFCMQSIELNAAIPGSVGKLDDFRVQPIELNQTIDGSTYKWRSSATAIDDGFNFSVESLQEPTNMSCPEVHTRNRNVLTLQNARDIYLCLLAGIDDRPGASVFVGQQYGVSPKTIRDIWNR